MNYKEQSKAFTPPGLISLAREVLSPEEKEEFLCELLISAIHVVQAKQYENLEEVRRVLATWAYNVMTKSRN